MKIRQLTVLFLGLLLTVLASCEYETIVPKDVVVPDVVSFSTDIAPMLVSAGCAGCHSGGTAPDLRADKSYAALTGGGFIDTDDPAASILIVKINEGHATSGNLTADQKAALLKWITDGAKNN